MLFNSPEFIFIFLPLVFLLFFGLAKKNNTLAISSLTLSSLFFYGWWDWFFLPVLLISILFNFFIAIYFDKFENEKRKFFLIFAISANLLLLVFYKYLDFFILALNSMFDLTIPLQKITLLVGVSFFTFTQIAFLVDVYYKKAKEFNLLNYILFVSYFPHLIAGPILHHANMMPQFKQQKIFKLNSKNILLGVFFLTIGLVKKIFLADYIAKYSTPVFVASLTTEPTMQEAWIGVLAYSLQLYFDFSAYCDMAIGISLLFNITLPINFASPYKSRSIIEFWRTWHMTLSQFLRDYLYIPLGGNRLGEFRRYMNLFLTMLLGGLWHGANWTFVVWGAMHGIYLVINHLFVKFRAQIGIARLPYGIALPMTLFAVVIAWVPFRAETWASAINMWQAMFDISDLYSTSANLTDINLKKAAKAVIAGFVLVLFLPNSQQIVQRVELLLTTKHHQKYWLLMGMGLGGGLAYVVMSLGHVSEFLYFQF